MRRCTRMSAGGAPWGRPRRGGGGGTGCGAGGGVLGTGAGGRRGRSRGECKAATRWRSIGCRGWRRTPGARARQGRANGGGRLARPWVGVGRGAHHQPPCESKARRGSRARRAAARASRRRRAAAQGAGRRRPQMLDWGQTKGGGRAPRGRLVFQNSGWGAVTRAWWYRLEGQRVSGETQMGGRASPGRPPPHAAAVGRARPLSLNQAAPSWGNTAIQMCV
ncbi:MAG: hypothetical protein J3K34DRAFT_36279 [Monoraphidium minutum]|nr:MAG: hypothetical protein J3K34DRAFT_36279 [Monoraphidium minutum]